jgi:acetoin utilization deacetylase AcuC-like enzyme
MIAKANSDAFKKVFEYEFKPALEKIVFISARFDAHIDGPLANLALCANDYI